MVFGPSNERNYALRMNKKERRTALFSILSQKVADHHVFALDELSLEAPKTKAAAQVFSKMPEHRSLLVILPEKNHAIQKSAANLPHVKVITAAYLNPYDLLRYEKIMFMEPSIKKAEEIFLSSL